VLDADAPASPETEEAHEQRISVPTGSAGNQTQDVPIEEAGGHSREVRRFGFHVNPLSGSRVLDSELECLWHRSRFDVRRTGKVTEGPAKGELKTFETAAHDDKIFARSAGRRPPAHG
jgi:hypothetical protein